MRQVLYISVIFLTIISTACGASLEDAERNILGTSQVDMVLYRPTGAEVNVNDYFVVCSEDGKVGIATLKLNPVNGLVDDVKVRWLEKGTACGLELVELANGNANYKALRKMLQKDVSLEEIKKFVQRIEKLEPR